MSTSPADLPSNTDPAGQPADGVAPRRDRARPPPDDGREGHTGNGAESARRYLRLWEQRRASESPSPSRDKPDPK